MLRGVRTGQGHYCGPSVRERVQDSRRIHVGKTPGICVVIVGEALGALREVGLVLLLYRNSVPLTEHVS